MTQEKIVITGGAGFIGSHLADGFLAAGHQVIVIDNLSSGRREQVPGEAAFHELDIRSDEAAELIRGAGASVLCHQAAQMNVRKSVEDPRYDAEVNILGMLNVVEAARAGGVRQILFASSGGCVYGEQQTFPATESHPTQPICPYGVSKLAAERYLYYYHHEQGLDVTNLRYANVYGPRQNPLGEAGVIAIFAKLLLEGKTPTIYGDGEQTRDYVDVRDVVAANIAALGTPGYHAFNVGTGRETSVNELAALLHELLGGNKPEHGPARSGELRRNNVDAQKLADQLGVAMKIRLEDGLKVACEAFRAEYAS